MSDGRRRPIFRALALLSLFLPRCGVPVHPPMDSALLTDIEAQLSSQLQVAAPATAEVVSVIFEFPEGPGDEGEVLIERQANAAVPRVGMLDEPGRALRDDGLYISVQNDAGEFVNLLKLSGPGLVRSEQESGGQLQADVSRAERRVIAARLSYAESGSVKVFETAGGRVTKAYMDVSLERPRLIALPIHWRVPE